MFLAERIPQTFHRSVEIEIAGKNQRRSVRASGRVQTLVTTRQARTRYQPSLKVNHEGHEVTRRKLMPRTAFVDTSCPSWFKVFPFMAKLSHYQELQCHGLSPAAAS